jgi:hypothetical protein
LTELQAAIKELIMERFDVFANQKGVGSTSSEEAVPSTESVNGHDTNGAIGGQTKDSSSPSLSSSPQKRQAQSDEPEDNESNSPPPKKRKPDHDIDADALFAAKLQAEENKRARPTRGSATRKTKTAPVKKKKSKTAKKVEDSDLESSPEAGAKKEVNRSGGFHVSQNRQPQSY